MSRNTQRDAQTHIKRLNSEKLIFPVNIFRTPDKLFNSVKNAESHDVKIDRIPFPVLKILTIA